MTVDEVCAANPVALIKIDVEGHEGAVVRGAAGVIGRHAPSVVFEYAPELLDDPAPVAFRLAGGARLRDAGRPPGPAAGHRAAPARSRPGQRAVA